MAFDCRSFKWVGRLDLSSVVTGWESLRVYGCSEIHGRDALVLCETLTVGEVEKNALGDEAHQGHLLRWPVDGSAAAWAIRVELVGSIMQGDQRDFIPDESDDINANTPLFSMSVDHFYMGTGSRGAILKLDYRTGEILARCDRPWEFAVVNTTNGYAPGRDETLSDPEIFTSCVVSGPVAMVFDPGDGVTPPLERVFLAIARTTGALRPDYFIARLNSDLILSSLTPVPGQPLSYGARQVEAGVVWACDYGGVLRVRDESPFSGVIFGKQAYPIHRPLLWYTEPVIHRTTKAFLGVPRFRDAFGFTGPYLIRSVFGALLPEEHGTRVVFPLILVDGRTGQSRPSELVVNLDAPVEISTSTPFDAEAGGPLDPWRFKTSYGLPGLRSISIRGDTCELEIHAYRGEEEFILLYRFDLAEVLGCFGR